MGYRDRGLVEPRCPRCRCLLSPLRLEGGSALGCHDCGGVLLDDAGFAAVRDRSYASILQQAGAPPSVPQHDATASLDCPICGEAMGRTRLASVPVDICAQHGSWFDVHELVVIAQAIADRRGFESNRSFDKSETLPWARSRQTAIVLAALHAELQQRVGSAEAARGECFDVLDAWKRSHEGSS